MKKSGESAVTPSPDIAPNGCKSVRFRFGAQTLKFKVMETSINTSVLTLNDIQTLKSQLVRYIGMDRWNNNSMMDIKDEYLTLVDRVADAATGFAKDVATTVSRSERISEKQAYVISRAACELGLSFSL